MSQPVHLAHDLSGNGPLLVLIHGITENRTYWDAIDLTDHHRVLRVDLPGYGASAPISPRGIDDAAAAVHALMTTVADDEPPVVIGHSLGGVVATAYAADHPVAGVINVDQPLSVAPLPTEVADTVRGPGFPTMAREMFASFYGELDPALAADLESRRSYDQAVFLDYWHPLLEWDADTLAAWSTRITTLPSSTRYLSLHGTDPGDGYEGWLTERIPGAVVEHAPVRTHYPHLARPEWFVERVHRFVD